MKKIKLFLAAVAAMVGLSAQAQTWTGNEVAAGDFYLYNIGTGKWLTSGNSWGTQASLVEAGGFCSTLEISDGKYAIKNTETRTNNKAAGPGYLGTNAYMDGESAAYFTFTEVSGRGDGVKAYYIQNGTNNLAYSGSGTVVSFGTETGDNAQWVLVTKADRLAAMANATEANPVDATFLLKNPEFGRYKLPAYDAAWTFTFPSETNKKNAGDNTNFCVESYHVAFDFAQTVADAPNGYYAVRGQAFYRQDGSDNTNLPYFYVGSAKVAFPAKTGSENSMSDASTSFTAGTYQTAWSNKAAYAGGGLKVGAHLDNNTALWCIWDNIQIQYYGPIDLSAYATELANAVAAAEAYESQLPAAAYSPIAAAITENNKTYTSEAEYTAAITAITTAVSTYVSSSIVSAYSNYKTIKANILAINSSFDVSAADTEVEAATTTDGINAAITTLQTSFKSYLVTIEDAEIDITEVLITNPGFELGNVTGWTNSGTEAAAAQGNKAFDNTQGNYYAERWHAAGTVNLNQTLTDMPAGYYELSAYVYTDTGDGKLYANDTYTAFSTSTKYTLPFQLTDAGSITFGASCTLTVTTWICMDGFAIKFLGSAPLGIFKDKLQAAIDAGRTTVEALAVPAGVKSTFETIASDYEAAKDSYTTVAECEAAITAVEAAVEAAADAVSATAMNAPVLAKAVATAALDALAGDDAATLQEVIDANTNALAACTTAAEVEAQNAALWTAIGVAINSIELTGDETLDLTYLLTNPDLTGMGNGAKDGWYTDQNQPVQNSQAMTDNNAVANSTDNTKYAFYVYWSYNTEATDGFTVYQKVTLPEGTYQMNALAVAGWGYGARYADGTRNVTFSANDVDGTQITTTTLEEASLEFVQTEAGEVKIGLKAHAGNTSNWMGIGYVTFYKVAEKVIGIDENVDYVAESAAGTVNLTRTINADTWNTFVVPFQITNEELMDAFGDDVAVAEYSDAGDSEDNVTVSFNTMDTPAITANKPVLIKTSTAGTSYTFENRTVAASTPVTAGTYFNFVGTYDASTTLAEGDYFISSNKLYKSSGATTIKGTRAYLKAKSANVKGIKLFIDGITTGISEINGAAASEEQGAIYTLAGQRVQKAQKGLYIVNGKKVLVK